MLVNYFGYHTSLHYYFRAVAIFKMKIALATNKLIPAKSNQIEKGSKNE
jgi:hypothetical protein